MEYKIIVGLVGLLVTSWTFFGFMVNRYISGTDDKFQKLFDKTDDLPAIREAIEWLKLFRKEIDK